MLLPLGENHMATRRGFVKTLSAGLLASTVGIRNVAAQLVGSKYKFIMESGPGPETVINGKKYLYFGGTGYLGLQTHPKLINAAKNALAEYGLQSATSRNVFGTSPLYLEVEKTATKLFDTQDAIYLPSGYLVNIAGFQSLRQLKRFDAMFVDSGSHWSITDFMHALERPVFTFEHGDADDLGRKLKASLGPGQRPLIVSDGIFPTFGKVAPIPDYVKHAQAYGGCMWLDDCHAIGVLGENGRGTYEYYGLKSEGLYFGGTLSKAIGAHGGIVPGREDFVLPIRSGHIINGANASPSAAAAAAVAGMQLMMTDPHLRQQLWRNARRFKAGLRNIGFEQDDSPVPIAAWTLKTSDEMDRIHSELMDRGIAIQRTRYIGAGPNGALRAVVFANHATQQIDHLLDVLKSTV
jgi:8-amino-7-oxononanoate synthase